MWALNWKAHFQVFSFEKTRQTNPSSPLSYASLESTTEETLPKRLKLLQSSCKKRFRILRFNQKSPITGSCYVGLTSRERGTSEEYFICSLSKYLFFNQVLSMGLCQRMGNWNESSNKESNNIFTCSRKARTLNIKQHNSSFVLLST